MTTIELYNIVGGTFQNIRSAHDILRSHSKIIVSTMDGMAHFNISAEEEEMLLDMDELSNSIPIGSSINLSNDPRNQSLSGEFCYHV